MGTPAVLPPRDNRYFEDYAPGSTYELGSILVEEAEVIAFAQRYDPQYFHTDPERAKDGPFGRLAASGWMTAGLFMRLMVENYASPASLGSPGVDEIRWLNPVFPGDTLTARTTVLESRRSRSRPDRGIVTGLSEVFNQDGERVMTMKAMGMILCRS